MTRTRFAHTGTSEQDTKPTTTSSRGGGGGTVMRIIVPLQGVVQGRGGLFLGSVIPCALFYFLQLYLKRHRSAPSTPPPPPQDAAASYPPSSSEGQLPEVSVLSRSFSRIHLSPRSPGGPAYLSSRVNLVLKGGDSLYDIGLRKVSEDPYHEAGNPDGVIQLGLAENKLSLDLVRDWLAENAREAMLGGGRSGEELNIDGIASYQPFDGLMELKVKI